MANLKIDVDAVAKMVEGIRSNNNQIRDALPSVQNAIKKLDNSWSGPTADGAIRNFNEIISKYSDARYNVLENYANFLSREINIGYIRTEMKNVFLAEQFK